MCSYRSHTALRGRQTLPCVCVMLLTHTLDTREDILGYTRLASIEKSRETKIQVGEEEKATTTHWAVIVCVCRGEERGGGREGEGGRG